MADGDETAQKSAILAWLDTFPDAPGPEDFTALNDGTRLAKVLRIVAGDGWGFPELPAADGDSWVLRSSNLRKLLRSVRTFYNEDLGKDADFDDVDVGAAAKGEDGGAGALALAKYVLGCAVSCDDKDTYVHAVMQLDVTTQMVLMRMIQNVMDATWPVADPDARPEALGGEGGKDGTGGEAAEVQRRLETDLRSKDEAIAALQKELATVRTEQAQRAQIGEEAAQAGVELERLRMELRKATVRITDLEVSVERAHAETSEAQKQGSLAVQQKTQIESEVEQLAEEVDVLRGKEDQLSRVEAQMERMRVRLEQLSVFPKRLEEQDAKAAEYFQQVLSLEAEVKDMPALREKVESYKEKANLAEQEKVEALSDVAVKEAEADRLGQEKLEILEEKKMLEDRVSGLKSQLSQAEESGAMSPSARSAPDMFGASTELREKVLRLEHENAMLRQEKQNLEEATAGAAATPSHRDSLLSGELGGALRDKGDREAALLREQKRVAELEQEVQQLRSESDSRSSSQIASYSALESELASVRTQLEEAGRLSVRMDSLSKALNEREAEVTRLDAEKTKIEAFTKRALKTVHEKYTHSLQIVKDEAQARQRRVEHLENKLDAVRAAQKREERLMVSAVYELGTAIMNKNIFD